MHCRAIVYEQLTEALRVDQQCEGNKEEEQAAAAHAKRLNNQRQPRHPGTGSPPRPSASALI